MKAYRIYLMINLLISPLVFARNSSNQFDNDIQKIVTNDFKILKTWSLQDGESQARIPVTLEQSSNQYSLVWYERNSQQSSGFSVRNSYKLDGVQNSKPLNSSLQFGTTNDQLLLVQSEVVDTGTVKFTNGGYIQLFDHIGNSIWQRSFSIDSPEVTSLLTDFPESYISELAISAMPMPRSSLVIVSLSVNLYNFHEEKDKVVPTAQLSKVVVIDTVDDSNKFSWVSNTHAEFGRYASFAVLASTSKGALLRGTIHKALPGHSSDSYHSDRFYTEEYQAVFDLEYLAIRKSQKIPPSKKLDGSSIIEAPYLSQYIPDLDRYLLYNNGNVKVYESDFKISHNFNLREKIRENKYIKINDGWVVEQSSIDSLAFVDDNTLVIGGSLNQAKARDNNYDRLKQSIVRSLPFVRYMDVKKIKLLEDRTRVWSDHLKGSCQQQTESNTNAFTEHYTCTNGALWDSFPFNKLPANGQSYHLYNGSLHVFKESNNNTVSFIGVKPAQTYAALVAYTGSSYISLSAYPAASYEFTSFE